MNVIKILKNGTDSFKELLTIYVGTVLSAAVLFSIFEKVSFFSSLWWAFVTALTVGYGDLYAHTVGGRIVSVLLMHLVILLIIPLIIGRAVTQLIDNENEFTDKEQKEIMRILRKLDKEKK